MGSQAKRKVWARTLPQEEYLPCTKHRVCHHEAGSLVSNYQSAQTTYVAVSQGLAFLREPAKILCLFGTSNWGVENVGTQIPRDSLGLVNEIWFPFRGQLKQQGGKHWCLCWRQVLLSSVGLGLWRWADYPLQTCGCQEYLGLFPSCKSCLV